jgi:cytochrome b561
MLVRQQCASEPPSGRPGSGDLQLQPGRLSFGAMQLRNSALRWGSVAQFLHWVVVVLVITQFVLALIAADLPLGMRKLAVLARHKSVGITIFMLVVLRLLWRWMNATPPLPSGLKPYERVLAMITHAGLYVLLLAMPLTGWVMSSARNFPVSWFSVLQLPDLVAPNQTLYRAMVQTHIALAWTLVAVVGLHVLAALKHHFVLRDDVLRRMLPFNTSRQYKDRT